MSYRPVTLLRAALFGSIVLCFMYAAARVQLPNWWRQHGGGIPYVFFWIMLWMNFIPRRDCVLIICVACVVLTCCLEVMQLYEGPNWLYEFRRTTLGAGWLGSGFDVWDIPPYFIGGALGWYTGNVLLRPESPQ